MSPIVQVLDAWASSRHTPYAVEVVSGHEVNITYGGRTVGLVCPPAQATTDRLWPILDKLGDKR